jgi:hypothetical protein
LFGLVKLKRMRTCGIGWQTIICHDQRCFLLIGTLKKTAACESDGAKCALLAARPAYKFI